MTKTCGKCGHAALDDQAQFCNRCGAAVPKERKTAFPVCPGCGSVVSDELAQFCNRCGTKISPVPVVCGVCGSPALDSQSLFCTRCGTTFEKRPVFHVTTCPSCGAPDPQGHSVYCNRCGTPLNRPEPRVDPLPGPAPVLVTPRKSAGSLPPVNVPDTDWEPWNDIPYPGPSGESRPAPAQQPRHDQQIDIPQKRYSHLPLVADDMRKKGDPLARQLVHDNPAAVQKKRSGTQKKGVLGFLKK